MSFNSIFLTGEEKAIIDQATALLKQMGNVNSRVDERLPFRQFFLLKDYLNFEVLQALEVQKDSASVSVYFVDLRYRSLSGKYSSGFGSDQQAYIVGRLNKSYGNIILHKETLFNKIYELFTPLEMDFDEDAAFSSKFYVLSRDHDLARKFFSLRIREALFKIPHFNLYLEVNANSLLIGNMKSIAGMEVREMAQLALDITNFLNH